MLLRYNWERTRNLASPERWLPRFKRLLERVDAEPDWVQWKQCCSAYYSLLKEADGPDRARQEIQPQLDWGAAAFQEAAREELRDPRQVRSVIDVSEAYACVLQMLLGGDAPSRDDRARALRLVPALVRRAERCYAAVGPLHDGDHPWLYTHAFGILRAEAERRYREGDRDAARTLHDRALAGIFRAFDFHWREADWEDSGLLRCSVLVRGFADNLQTYPSAAEEPWRPDAVRRLRRLLRARIGEARAQGDLARAAAGQWMLSDLSYLLINKQSSTASVALYEAHRALDAAAGISDILGRRRAELRAARTLGIAAGVDGDAPGARAAWARALELADAIPAREGTRPLVRILVGLGASEISLGLVEPGYRRLREAERLQEAWPDREAHLAAADPVYAELARAHLLLGNVAEAERYYGLAARAAGSRLPIHQFHLAEMHYARHLATGAASERKAADALYVESAARRGFNDVWVQQVCWQALARHHELGGRREAAMEAWTIAGARARQRQDRPAQAYIRLALGRLLLRSGASEAAEAKFRLALDHGQESGYRELVWQALLARAEARDAEGRYGEALADYGAAAREVERLREASRLPPESAAGLLPEAAEVYRRAALLALRLGQREAAYGWVRRYKAQVLRRLLYGGPALEARHAATLERPSSRAVALRQRVGALEAAKLDAGGRWPAARETELRAARARYERAAAHLRVLAATAPVPEAPPAPSLAELERLARHERLTLVDYSATDEGLLTFVITGDGGLQVFREAEATLPRLTQVGAAFTARCANVSLDPAEHGAQLYEWLIRPMEAHLPPNHTLVMVPDGPLHGIPFAALKPRGKASYLIEQRPIATAASLDVLYGSFRQTTRLGPATVLARGYGARPQEVRTSLTTRATFGPLPAAIPEAEAVAQALGASLFTDAEASRERFTKALGGGLAWFTGHVHYNAQDPASSALVLARGEQHDLYSVRDLARLPRNPGLELVVLTGCEGAQGLTAPGEGLVGLAWALQKAGARSVVACAWEVNDRATGALMTEFARNLRTRGRAEALRQAQLGLLRERQRHPYYWAGPLLVGRTDSLRDP
jgi:CHAT domain-containing protein